jgi:hypothetical protein
MPLSRRVIHKFNTKWRSCLGDFRTFHSLKNFAWKDIPALQTSSALRPAELAPGISGKVLVICGRNVRKSPIKCGRKSGNIPSAISFHEMTFFDNKHDILQVLDVIQRVFPGADDVRKFTGLNRASFLVHSTGSRSISGDGDDRLHG